MDPMWSWLGFHVMTTEDMDPDDLQLITNQKIPDVDQSDPVHQSESTEVGAEISKANRTLRMLDCKYEYFLHLQCCFIMLLYNHVAL